MKLKRRYKENDGGHWLYIDWRRLYTTSYGIDLVAAEQKMIIKLVFDAQFCGNMEVVITVPDDITYKEVEDLFEQELGVKYDDNCYYEVLDG